MKKTALAIIMGFVACGEMAWTQSDEKPAPKAPYLAAVPDYGHWIVTFKYEASATDGPAAGASSGGDKPQPATDGTLSVIDTIKTGDLRGVVLTFSNGITKQFTCQGDWVLASTPNGPQLGVASPSQSPYVYYTTCFILLDGVKIDPSTFKETAKRNGALAFHYKSGETDVWIDIATMLPLAVKVPGVEGAYQFLPAPPRPFAIPQDQADLLQKKQKAYRQTRSLR